MSQGRSGSRGGIGVVGAICGAAMLHAQCSCSLERSAAEPAIFDLPAIRDAATADCRFEGEHPVSQSGVPLVAWSVSYLSWESIDGTLHPIRIRGFAARPAAKKGRFPAVVQAHGLGGSAETESANMLAARLGMFALTFSGPGSGTDPANTSEGRPSSFASGYRMFDTQRDVRGSWFWAHTVAAMRALSCLSSRRDVDPGRLGMTGFSAGAVASLLAASVDNRLQAVVPLSGSLFWREAARAPAAWQHSLLAQSHLDLTSPEWELFNRQLLDPQRRHRGTPTRVLLVNGSIDEFFPVTAHLATLRAIPGPRMNREVRNSLIGNYDHGCYRNLDPASVAQIAQRASVRAEGGQRLWFRHYLSDDPSYPVIPRAPQLHVQTEGTQTLFVATVQQPSAYLVEEVRLWWSKDRSYHYSDLVLEPTAAGRYELAVEIPLGADTVYFVDVQYRTREAAPDPSLPHSFSISSEPVLAPGLVPHIRDQGSCQ